MALLQRFALAGCLAAVALLTAHAQIVVAQQPRITDQAASDAVRRASAVAPVTPELSAELPSHALSSVIDYARQEQEYLKQTVRDFTCRLVKRERIDGFLQDNQFIDMKVREEVREGSQIAAPFAIYLHFLAPTKIAGRRVLYVNGQNEGKMLVRNGGKHFDYVVVQVDPNGDSARDESLVPITDSGFNRLLSQMISILERHVKADPSGENTKVERIERAKLNKRPCHVIRIVHPRQQDGLEFHVANVFIDDALHLPVRVDFSAWPKQPDQRPPLTAEYTYTELKVNVGLSDRDFRSTQLRGNR